MSEPKGRREFVKSIGRGLGALFLCKVVFNASACSEGERMSISPADPTTELKQRISSDNPGNFNPAIWDQVRFGSYYDEDQD